MGCGKLQWVVASCSALCYSYSAFCNSFDAIMFTALLFFILVFVWAAHCRSGQFWAGLGGSEQVFAAQEFGPHVFAHQLFAPQVFATHIFSAQMFDMCGGGVSRSIAILFSTQELAAKTCAANTFAT